jgi:hypothetical protein
MCEDKKSQREEEEEMHPLTWPPVGRAVGFLDHCRTNSIARSKATKCELYPTSQLGSCRVFKQQRRIQHVIQSRLFLVLRARAHHHQPL